MSQLGYMPELTPRVPTGAAPPPQPGLPEGIGAAINSEWIGSWLFRRFEAQLFVSDPDYDPFSGDGKQWKELTDGLDPDYWSSLGEARSMPQALKMREQLMGVQRSRQTLAQMGWTGTALQIGANIIDPVNVATMAIPGVGPASLAAKSGRAAWIVKGGLAVGLPNAALEGIRAFEDPQYGAMQAATAGLGGFGFGAGTTLAMGRGRLTAALYGGGGQALGTAAGTIPDPDVSIKDALWSIGISGALGTPFGALSSRMHKEMELSEIDALGGKLDDFGREYFKGVEAGRVSEIQTSIQEQIDASITGGIDELNALSVRARALRSLAESPGYQVLVEGVDVTASKRAELIQEAEIIEAEVLRRAPIEPPITFDGDDYAVSGPKPAETIDEDGVPVASAAKTTVPPTDGPGDSSVGAAPGTPQPTKPIAAGAGAATPGNIALSRWASDEIFDYKAKPTDARDTFAAARFGMSASFSRSEVPDIRAVGNMVFDDVMAKADGSLSSDSAERAGRRFGDVVRTDYIRTSSGAVEGWLKAQGVPLWGRGAAVDRLFDEVGRAQRRMTQHSDPHIRALVQAQRDAIERVWAFGYRMGVPGFDSFAPNDLYVTRIYSLPAIAKAINNPAWGLTEVVTTLAESIQARQTSLSTREAMVIAQSMLKDITRAKSGLGLDPSLRYNTSDRAALAAIIRDNVSGVTDDEVAAILNKLHKTEGEGTITRSMYRVRLDETYRSSRTSLSIEDLLENNAFHILDRYVTEITGAGVVSETLRGYSEYIGRKANPIKSIDEFRRVISERADNHLGLGQGEKKTGVAGQIDTLANMLAHLRGAPLNTGQRADFLRVLRKAQFSRVMNFAGLAQVPEIANIISQAGFGTVVRAMPNLLEMFKKGADGQLSNAAAREAEALFAHEAGTLRGSVTERMDWREYEPRNLGPIERGLDRMNAVTRRYLSGLDQVNTLMSRSVGILAEQMWFDIAKSGKVPSKARLAAMGMDEAMAKRVVASINDPVNGASAVPGTRAVKVLNPGNWTDAEAASALIVAMDRWSRRVVQQGDLGQMSAWMTKDWGQTLIQFRSFMIASYEKQLLYPIATRDWRAFSSWLPTMVMGGITYTGATYAQSWGKPERERKKFLKERLSLQAISMAAFNRGGWSSVIPMIWDTQAQWTGAPQFAASRMSGLGGDPLTGNPSMAMLYDAMWKVPKAAFRMATEGRAPTRGEARTMTSLLPFQNAIGIRNVINAVTGGLREEAP